MFGSLPVIVVDGTEWFGATEAAEALGFAKPHRAIENPVDADDPRHGWGRVRRTSMTGFIARLERHSDGMRYIGYFEAYVDPDHAMERAQQKFGADHEIITVYPLEHRYRIGWAEKLAATRMRREEETDHGNAVP
jgi:hypothetical protein